MSGRKLVYWKEENVMTDKCRPFCYREVSVASYRCFVKGVPIVLTKQILLLPFGCLYELSRYLFSNHLYNGGEL